MTSLPLKVPPTYEYNAHVKSAYDMCLRVEKSLQEASNNGQNVEKDLICIRILGFLVHNIPTDGGLRTFIYELSSTNGDPALLLRTGKLYFNHFIRAFKATKGKIPAPSNHPARRSFDTLSDMIYDTLEEPTRSHDAAKRKALIRDGYRCVVSNHYDFTSVEQSQDLTDRVIANDLRTVSTNCAHIFPASTNLSIEVGSDKRYYAASLWTVMQRFSGGQSLPEELNGPNIHRLENVMTVAVDFHYQFDQLKVWFVPTNVENRYKLESTGHGFLEKYQEHVTFTTPDPVMYPVPSRTYLELHAACARVAHLSGAGECIDRLYRENEDRQPFGADGGSVDILETFELEHWDSSSLVEIEVVA